MTWRKDGETLGSSGTGYEIVTDYPADLTATTSLDFTGQFLSRSFGGNYDVIISNNNDVIPESDRTASVSFSISVTGEYPVRLTDFGSPRNSSWSCLTSLWFLSLLFEVHTQCSVGMFPCLKQACYLDWDCQLYHTHLLLDLHKL